jgi:hypothetical protein
MWYMKSVGIFAIVAAYLSSPPCNAMARGVGQGEHEADSGGGVAFGGGYSYSGGVGQGHYGPGGPYGAAVPSGIDSSAVGQAQHEGRGYYQSAPAIESRPLVGSSSVIAARRGLGVRVVVDPHYRYADGIWFYQMPDNSWVRWDNGKWVNADQTVSVQPSAGPIAKRITLDAGRR